jgi:hypothetical protein
MAKKSQPPEKKPANLSVAHMQAAIPKIDRRIAELREFDVRSVSDRSDPSVRALSDKLAKLMLDVYGADTIEYQQYKYRVTQLNTAPIIIGRIPPPSEIREGLEKGIANSIQTLETIRDSFIEDIEDSGHSPTLKPLKAYEGLDLHRVYQ